MLSRVYGGSATVVVHLFAQWVMCTILLYMCLVTLVSLCVTVSLGTVPSGDVLKGLQLPPLEEGGSAGGEVGETPAVRAVKQASSIMALLSSQTDAGVAVKAPKVWLGEGLGSLLKRTYDKAIRWECVDLAEFRPKSAVERWALEADTHKVVVLPGFEVAQAKQKPVTDIVTWMQCFGRYMAAMTGKFPECSSGFISHMLTVLRAYVEVEEPGWRLYDEAFRDKMASTGVRSWTGMDVKVYQEVCGGRSKRRAGGPSVVSSVGWKRPTEGRKQYVCWQFNEGHCSYGPKCKFPHVCESCRGQHSKKDCPSGKRQRLM